MSSPASVFSSPSTYSRHPATDDAIKQTPRNKISPFANRNYTPSPLERNKNLIKSLSSALSSTPRNLKKPLIFHTPQSVTSQLNWHPHSTPQSQVRNPFEIALVNQLQSSMVSPGIFTISTPSSDDKKFHWTIDQLAILHPVEIDDKQSQYTSVISPTLEERAQKDIEKYFATHVIVPSPAEDPLKIEKNEILIEDAKSSKFVEVGCQTTLSLPQDVNLYDILGEYMTYKDKKSDSDCGGMDSFSTSSLRRKLFCQGYQEESFASNKESAKSEDHSSREDESPAPIPSTPDWDKRLSMDPLSSSPIDRRNRRYMTNLSCDSFGFTHSSPNFSPIGLVSSPLTARPQHVGKRGSVMHLEDSRKQLFSSPCSSPVRGLDDLPGRNSDFIGESNMDISTISLKTPTSSPSKKLSDSTELIFNSSFFTMSPLFSSVKKELQLMNPGGDWSFSSDLDVSFEENAKDGSVDPKVYSICEKIETSLCAGDAKAEPSFSRNESKPDDKNKINNHEDPLNHNAINDLQNTTSSISANFSIMPSKLEVTNVDTSRSVSTFQHDTGYMSYNTTGSMPSRSEISQCSKSAFSIYNTSSLDLLPESVADAARQFPEKCLRRVGQPKVLGIKPSAVPSCADSLLDYDDVVDRAQQVLSLTSRFCIHHQSEKHQGLELTDKDRSNDPTDVIQWHPIGASTPTHKGNRKSASETAAEILQKAQEDLNKLSRDKLLY